jgi:signal transduction histidine kinase
MLLMCLPHTARAQTIPQLSLSELLITIRQSDLSEKERIQSYIDLSAYYYWINVDSAILFADMAIAEAGNSPVLRLSALLQQIENYARIYQDDRVVKLTSEVEKLTESAQLSNARSDVGFTQCWIALHRSNYLDAWKFWQMASSFHTGQAVQKCKGQWLMGLLYLKSDLRLASIKILEKTSSACLQARSEIANKLIQLFLADNYKALDQSIKANSLWESAVMYFNENNLKLALAEAYKMRGSWLMQEGDWITSEKFYGKAQLLYSSAGLILDASRMQVNRANTIYESGNKNAAAILLQQSWQQIQTGPIVEEKLIAVNLMASLEKALGHQDKAQQYTRIYTSIKDSFSKMEQKDSLNIQLARHDMQLVSEGYPETANKSTSETIVYVISGLLIVLTLSLLTVLVNQKSKGLKEMIAQQSELEEKTRQLEQMNQVTVEKNNELARINNIKDKLLGMIAHDVRSPLHSLQSTLALVQDETLTRDEFRMLTQSLDSEIFNLRNMLDNMILWAREQMTEVEITKANVNLGALVSDTIKLFSNIAAVKQLTIHNYIPQQLSVFTDKEAMLAVIRNLLSNAIKFTPTEKNIYVQFVPFSNKLYLSIRDEGIGIEKEILEKIKLKEHFSRRGTSNEKGTGIGLMFTQELLLKMGEEIDIISNPGQGTSVTVSISTDK